MTSDRWENQRRSKAIDAAYRAGDLAALLQALGHPPNFPNCRQPAELGIGDHPIEYAIYWSPLAFIEELLAGGADPNYEDEAGFPSLIAALSSNREDRYELLRLLIDKGANINQRGLNDWTPLHYAVAQRDIEGVRMLLDYGADPALKTRIDDCSSPLEDAESLGEAEILTLLRAGKPA